MDYSKITLGELLSSENETIKRNAVSILKVCQKTQKTIPACKHKHIVYGHAEWCEDCKEMIDFQEEL